jgi:CMP-2-keto-3-deoxyoctulosonic acid synthetase
MSKAKIIVTIQGKNSPAKEKVFNRIVESLKRGKKTKVVGVNLEKARIMTKEEKAKAKNAEVLVLSRKKYARKAA